MHKHVPLRLTDLDLFVNKNIYLFKPECKIESLEEKLKQLECQFNKSYENCQLLLLKRFAKQLEGDHLNHLFKLFCDQFWLTKMFNNTKANVNNGSFTGSSFANHPLNRYLKDN